MCMRVVLCQMKKGRLAFVDALHRVERCGEEFLVGGLHPRCSQRTSVLDGLHADPAETRIDSRVILVRGARLEHAARTEALLELRVFWIVDVLRLLFGIEVIEIAEELIEAMHGRQVLVAVAEVVLAVLERHVAVVLQQVGNGRVFFLKTERRARQADLEQSGTERRLAGDERGAPGSAGLLAVVVGEKCAFARDPIDVGRFVAHHALVVGADVPVADIVAENDEDVRLLRRGLSHRLATRAPYETQREKRKQHSSLYTSHRASSFSVVCRFCISNSSFLGKLNVCI